MPLKIFGPEGDPIRTLGEWERFGGPQSPSQWRDGRSAKECAKSWLRHGRPALPAELLELFASHPTTTGLTAESAYPEVETRLDGFNGKGRFHDVVLEATCAGGKLVASIEAKADEAFGDLVIDARATALARTAGTKVPARMKLLGEALFGSEVYIEGLRYQLLYAIAGSLIEARKRGADLAAFIVHEFAFAGHVDANKLDRNANDLDTVLGALGLDQLPQLGCLVEVPSIPGGPFVPSDIPLFVGKTRVT